MFRRGFEESEELRHEGPVSAAHVGGYDGSEMTRRVAELNAPAPIERDVQRSHSLWE